MAIEGRIYKRTEAGRKAWDTQDAHVPLEYRRILGLLAALEVHTDEIRARVGRYTEDALQDLLTELELRGLVESRPESAEQDLDFTTELNLADILSAARKKPD